MEAQTFAPGCTDSYGVSFRGEHAESAHPFEDPDKRAAPLREKATAKAKTTDTEISNFRFEISEGRRRAGGSKDVWFHDIRYRLCQDIRYTWIG